MGCLGKQGHGRDVLVAEDNAMMASLMQLQLRQLNYRSYLCANGQEVWACFSRAEGRGPAVTRVCPHSPT